MSSKPQAIAIERSKGNLPTCTPYLMPFHIEYTGPAPISTYFRVKPAPHPAYSKDDILGPSESQETDLGTPENPEPQFTSASSQSTLFAASSSATLVSAESTICISPDIADANNALCSLTATSTVATASDRFVSVFRGRTVQGLQVSLPEGYSGLVLRGPNENMTAELARGIRQAQEKKSAQKRSTRRSARPAVIDVDADIDGSPELTMSQTLGAVVADAPSESETLVRVLQPTSTFSSLVVWHQDIPVDEGRDEYLRSLKEWTRIATEVHRIEDD